MIDRGHLPTEQPNPRAANLDALPLAEAFDLMNAEDHRVADAVAAAKAQIIAAVELVSGKLATGGRLIYVGAGTSGRLGVLDAAECRPTFLVDRHMVQGIIAGGDAALRRSAEYREDDPDYGAAEIGRAAAGPSDVVFGIATGGTTPFVHGALRRARERGAATVFLACVPASDVADVADVSIRVLTGPEVIAGSTRLKAGIATKMVLNTVSTLTMVRLGKVWGNLMVDVNAHGCAKLTDRAIRTTMATCGLTREQAKDLLDQAAWHVKTAIAMHHLGCDADQARRRLADCGGHLRRLLGTSEPHSCA